MGRREVLDENGELEDERVAYTTDHQGVDISALLADLREAVELREH